MFFQKMVCLLFTICEFNHIIICICISTMNQLTRWLFVWLKDWLVLKFFMTNDFLIDIDNSQKSEWWFNDFSKYWISTNELSAWDNWAGMIVIILMLDRWSQACMGS